MKDLAFLDATAQAQLVARGDVSPIELVDAAIARIDKLNPELNAVIHPLFDRARHAAVGALPDGPFRGVPAVVKDLDGFLAGTPYHAGNRALRDAGYVADHDSTLFTRLQQAGFVIVGKTNTPEFGLQPTTEPAVYGPTRNPWNTDRIAGGSSGGSAAAVASGMVAVGHAGDGGGSIRIPASCCGLVGLKPSRGRISLGPQEGEAWEGFVVRHVVARSVRDTATILDELEGPEAGDPYTAPAPTRPYRAELGTEPGRLRIGLLTHAPMELCAIDDDCVAAAEDAARLLESLGHHVESAAPAALDDSDVLGFFSTVLNANVAAELDEIAKLLGRPLTAEDVEPVTWMYAEEGRALTATTYVEAVTEAHAWSRRIARWWDDYDLLLTPTLAEPPAEIGDIQRLDGNPLEGLGRSLPFAVFTAPFNVTGQPAISLPLYWEASMNLPVGVQLVAAPWREDVLVRVAAQLETARPWADRRPPVHA